MRITKVYTRMGDKGSTRLAGGQEIAKDHLRIETYGTVDELNSIVGLARAFNQDQPESLAEAAELDETLHRIQDRLFDIGSILASPPRKESEETKAILSNEIDGLESLMDDCQKSLKPLEEFILPGGGKVAAFLHQARTVCRRAERLCVRLNKDEPVPEEVLRYVNRLSDVFFVLSRWIAQAQNENESLWRRHKE
ncbi:MAG: cob(I)yrinic acid a,c-diamide adenosyltransferase [bacterium]